MFKYELNYTNLIHLSKVKVNELKKRLTFYFDGKIETQTFANQSDFGDAVAELEDKGLLLIGETWYNVDRLSIVEPNAKTIRFNFIGNVTITHEYADVSEVEDVIGQIEEGFILINGKWYQGKQIHVAMSDPIALTVKYDFLGMDMFPVKYEDQAAFDEALDKLATIAEGGQGGGTPKVKTPKILPTGGEVEKGTEVTITCATEGATIHYTIDGSTPTAESPVYSSAITINSTTTVKAMATKTDMKNSSVATVKYIVNVPTVAKPVLAPAGGEVEVGTTVTITCATDGATIHYTTDGIAPTADSPTYTDPITINSTTTVKAIGVKEDYADSAVATGNYTVNVPTVAKPVISPAAGEVDSGTEVTITCATDGAEIHYTVDGSNPTSSSPVYSTPIEITAATTVKAIGIKTDMADSAVASASYTIKLYRYNGMWNMHDDGTGDTDPDYIITLDNIDTLITGLSWFEDNVYNTQADSKLAATTKSLGTSSNEWKFGANDQAVVGYQEIYAYPKSLGDITLITNNGFNATGSFTQHDMTFDGVVYNVIFLTDPAGGAGDTQMLSFN